MQIVQMHAPAAKIPATILDQGEFEFYTVTEHSIQFKPGAPREVWISVAEQLTAMHESSGRLHFRAICLLADVLNYGEGEFGEEYAQVISDTRAWMKVSSKTIQNAMWVMKNIAPANRHELLSLSHHEAVASLDPAEQNELLGKAEEESMTVAELRKAVATLHPKTKHGKERKTKSEAATPTISNLTEAKATATLLSNWLTANEDKITDSLEPVLKHFYRLYRRHWMSGHKR